MVELDNPYAATTFAEFMCDFADKNLLSGNLLTTLPSKFVSEKLAPSSSAFTEKFSREIELLSGGQVEYERQVDQILETILAHFKTTGSDSSDGTTEEWQVIQQ